MTSELTGDDLDAIQQRTDAFGSRGIYGYVINDIEYQGNWVHDIHRLLDEVDRLRARLASFDFEDCVSIGSQQVRIDALEDELSRLRAENTALAAAVDQFNSFPTKPGPGHWSRSYLMGYADAARDVRAIAAALGLVQDREGQADA